MTHPSMLIYSMDIKCHCKTLIQCHEPKDLTLHFSLYDSDSDLIDSYFSFFFFAMASASIDFLHRFSKIVQMLTWLTACVSISA